MEEQRTVPMPQNAEYLTYNNQMSNSIVTLTNPDSSIYKLELSLRGMMLDQDGNPKQIGSPLMNETGINNILSLTQSVVSQVTILSNLEKEIAQLMLFLNDALTQDLMMNRIKYGIKGVTDRTRIYSIVMMNAYITMRRAFQEGDRRFWKGSQQNIRTEIVNTEGSKKGWLSALSGWAKQ